MRARRFIWPVMLVIAVVVVVFVVMRPAPPIEVEIASARRDDVHVTFSADGRIVGREIIVSSVIPGELQSVLVSEGDAVSTGTVVAHLDDTQLRAALREAEAAVAAARSSVRTAETAVTITREQAHERIAQARARVTAAEAQLAQVRAGARTEEVAQAEQRLEQARANLDAAERALARARELFAQDVIARADLDAAEDQRRLAASEVIATEQAVALLRAGARPEEIRTAEAAVEAAQADVRAAQAGLGEVNLRLTEVASAREGVRQAEAAAARARNALRDAVLTAPTDGVVLRVPVEPGEVVAPGMPVVLLVDAREMYVEAEVGDEDAAQIAMDLPVWVSSAAYPGRRFEGVITGIASAAEPRPDVAVRARIVRTRIDLREGIELFRPGMEVDVLARTTAMTSALVVPSDAIAFRNDRTVVFILVGDRVEQKEVTTGYYSFEITEILGRVSEGDEVVLNPPDELEAGASVAVRR